MLCKCFLINVGYSENYDIQNICCTISNLIIYSGGGLFFQMENLFNNENYKKSEEKNIKTNIYGVKIIVICTEFSLSAQYGRCSSYYVTKVAKSFFL